MSKDSMDSDLSNLMPEFKLTEREILIARVSADLAVKKMTDNFYKEVGRTFVSRWLIIIGSMVVAFAMGKGWMVSPFK